MKTWQDQALNHAAFYVESIPIIPADRLDRYLRDLKDLVMAVRANQEEITASVLYALRIEVDYVRRIERERRKVK